MATLYRQKCHNHAHREAAAMCPECKGYFCKECVTEHDGKFMCTQCLRSSSHERSLRNNALLRRAGNIAAALCGFGVVWYGFYLLARMLLLIPGKFHDGTIW
ncbi:MAG: rhomboid family protein [Chitinivibrionales bacterium]|nr:rhomboid family protein [Chitinivibrionales bacterium]